MFVIFSMRKIVMTDTPNTPETSAAQNVQDTAARGEAFGTLVETMALLRAPRLPVGC